MTSPKPKLRDPLVLQRQLGGPPFGKGSGVEAECLLEHLPGADIPVRELIRSYGQSRPPEGELVQHQALHDAEQRARVAAELTAAGCHGRQVDRVR